MFVPYGEEESLLGSAPGGENLMLGPNYGAQAPDGTWWFLDGAKRRFAHYDRGGSYLESVYLPEDYLVDGVYFQYQLPRVLADGSLIAARFDETSTEFVIASELALRKLSVAGTQLPRSDDGSTLFGLDLEGVLWALDPETAEWGSTEWFRAQTGARYRVAIADDEIIWEMPDVPVARTIPLESTIGPGQVHASIEVAVGADGVTHLYVLGISESDETTQLAGYATIAGDGTVSEMEPMMNPFTSADPGSPSHLGVAYGSSSPYLMIIEVDGVEVYVRD